MNSEQASAISVRQARPEDAAQICHIHVNSVRSLCAKDYTQSQIEAWVGNLTPENYRYAMQEMGEIMFVAEKGGVIVGFSSLLKDEVRAVYVHPGYARQGIGKLLIDAVETEAFARSLEKLKVSSSTTAAPFYQARGYQIIEHSFHTLSSGVQIKSVSMEKALHQQNFP